MGLDVVTLGMANVAAGRLPRPASLAGITGRLRRGTEDVVLAVLGDSTGNDADEWVRLVAATLAARYPAYTVLHRLWNDTGQNYDAATTIATGSGSKTLTIYNGSMSGAEASYSSTTARLVAQTPVTPHAVIINYGHNTPGATARTSVYTLARMLQDRYRSAAIVLTAQNPRASGNADYANGNTRQQSIIDLAADEGYGLINVFQAYLANPTYGADWLNVDGLHPNAAGSQAWAAEVLKHLPDASSIVPSGPPPQRARVWLPAQVWTVSDGTPTLAAAPSNSGPAWTLPDAATSGVITAVDLPAHWGTYDAFAVWTLATAAGLTGSTNGVRFEISTRGLGAQLYESGTVSPGGTGGLSVLTATGAAINVGAAYSKHTTRLATNLAASATPSILRLRRLGTDGIDTLAENAYLLGVFLVRTS